jgi:hypothetical protein
MESGRGNGASSESYFAYNRAFDSHFTRQFFIEVRASKEISNPTHFIDPRLRRALSQYLWD